MSRRFEFRLERVLQVRRTLQDRLGRDLASLHVELLQSRQRVAALECARVAAQTEVRRAATGALELWRLRACHEACEALSRRGDEERRRLSVLRDREEELRVQYLESRKRVRLLEQVRERQFERWGKVEALAETKVLDEVSSALRRFAEDSA